MAELPAMKPKEIKKMQEFPMDSREKIIHAQKCLKCAESQINRKFRRKSAEYRQVLLAGLPARKPKEMQEFKGFLSYIRVNII